MKAIKELTGGVLAAALLAASTLAQAVVLSNFGVVDPNEFVLGPNFGTDSNGDPTLTMAKTFGNNPTATDTPIVALFQSDTLLGDGTDDLIYNTFENAVNLPPNAVPPPGAAVGDWSAYVISMEYFFIDTDGAAIPGVGGNAFDIGFRFDPTVLVVGNGGAIVNSTTVVNDIITVDASVPDGGSLLFSGPPPLNPDATPGYRIITTTGIVDGSVPIPGNAATFGIRLTQTPVLPAAAVPEPGSIALLGLGLVGLGAMRRRRS